MNNGSRSTRCGKGNSSGGTSGSTTRPHLSLQLEDDPSWPSEWCSVSQDDDAFAAEAQDRLVTVAKLGSGASASVFKAVDVDTLQLVAVKVIHFNSRDKKCASLIRREVAALTSQRAPMLVRTFGAGMTPCPYISHFYGVKYDKSRMQASIAMEYACCGSLEDWSKHGLPVPEPWLAHVAYSVLQALSFTHEEMDRVHRDIKPGNILLSDAGTNSMSVKLADFGSAVDGPRTAIGRAALRSGGGAAFMSACTTSPNPNLFTAAKWACHSDGGGGARDGAAFGRDDGLLLSPTGTRSYMAPERLAMEGYSFNSDIWSMGMALATAANGGLCPLAPAGKTNEFDQLGMALVADAIICDAYDVGELPPESINIYDAAAPVGGSDCLVPPGPVTELVAALAGLGVGADLRPRLSAAAALATHAHTREGVALARDSDSAYHKSSVAAARLNLSASFAPSRVFRDFLRRCLVPEARERPGARALLGHPFLAERAGWERRCPEVLCAAAAHRHSTNLNGCAAGTAVTAIATARQDGGGVLVSLTGAAPGIAALARELGVGEPELVGRLSRAACKVLGDRAESPLQEMWVGPSPCW